jgi:hypothetical protein
MIFVPKVLKQFFKGELDKEEAEANRKKEEDERRRIEEEEKLFNIAHEGWLRKLELLKNNGL